MHINNTCGGMRTCEKNIVPLHIHEDERMWLEEIIRRFTRLWQMYLGKATIYNRDH